MSLSHRTQGHGALIEAAKNEGIAFFLWKYREKYATMKKTLNLQGSVDNGDDI